MTDREQAQRVAEEYARHHYGDEARVVEIEGDGPKILEPGIEERDTAVTYAWTALIAPQPHQMRRVTLMYGPQGWHCVEVENLDNQSE